MKKAMIVLIAALMMLFAVSCGTEPSQAAIQSEPSAEVSAEEPVKEKDFPSGDYKDTGAGTMYVVTPAGTSEDGAVPVLFAESDSLIQIGLEAWDMDGSKLSYVYVDGYLNTKDQLADAQISINLDGSLLSAGTHKVEVVQYDTDQPDGKIVTYKVASYEVKQE